MQGGDQEMTAGAKRFSRQLEGRFGIESALVDERLTTREAYQIAIASGRKRTKLEIDSISAVLITESWLRAYDQNEDLVEN
jgi:putative Holliday junction resolvase